MVNVIGFITKTLNLTEMEVLTININNHKDNEISEAFKESNVVVEGPFSETELNI